MGFAECVRFRNMPAQRCGTHFFSSQSFLLLFYSSQPEALRARLAPVFMSRGNSTKGSATGRVPHSLTETHAATPYGARRVSLSSSSQPSPFQRRGGDRQETTLPFFYARSGTFCPAQVALCRIGRLAARAVSSQSHGELSCAVQRGFCGVGNSGKHAAKRQREDEDEAKLKHSAGRTTISCKQQDSQTEGAAPACKSEEAAAKAKSEEDWKKAQELAERARVADSLWQTFVPERGWGLTSPVFWILLVAVIVLHETNERRDRERANSITAADETEAKLREDVEQTRSKRRGRMETNNLSGEKSAVA